MERYTKKIICICLCSLIVALNIKVAHAEALPDVMCGSATVADCVMSYYAMSGAAVANTDWINTLYNDLGSSFGTIYDFAQNGMLTLNGDGTWQATTALETAIENAPAYQSLGLDQVFNVSSAEVAAGGGLAAASGGSILGGALGCTASVGVLPVLGGVTAAYWGGISIGNIITHLLQKYAPNIYGTYPITIDSAALSNYIPFGSRVATFYDTSNNRKFLISMVDGVSYAYQDGRFYIGMYNLKNESVRSSIIYIRTDGSIVQINNMNVSSHGNNEISSNYASNLKVANYFNNYSGFNTARNGWLNGSITPNRDNYSPDMIGENGNLSGEADDNQYTVPDMKPQIDPGVQSGVPLSLQDWLNFANSVKNNNSNTNPLPDNSALFDNILNLVKKAIPNPNPNPNPDPYTPPNPTPSPDPDYDPNPDNPNQPDYESEREGQTEPVPDLVPTGAPWITDGLLDKFPFCIPKDMIDMVKNFSSGTRQAPYISWRFNPPNTPVDYTFNLDLSDFEEIATLLRLLELGAFIVGLAFATRYLIGAT